MGLTLVLRAPSSLAPASRSQGEAFGHVVAIPDPFTSHVTVEMHPGGDLRSINMAWADRSEGFASFLELCADVFCLHVGICGSSAVSYSLYVDVAAAERQLAEDGFLRGEPFVSALICKLAPDATLPSVDAAEPTPAATPRTLRTAWTLPLRPAQRTSVDWLHGVESAVRRGETLQHDANVPLTPSLAFDTLRGEITTAAGRTLERRYHGAALANDIGTGKTCCIVRLVAEEEELPITSDSGALRSPATVVVCPVGMQQHWIDECRKFAPQLRVVTLTSVREMKALTLRSLLAECDIVLTTPNWLRSKANVEATEELVCRALRLEPDRRLVRKSVGPASRALSLWTHERCDAQPPALGVVTFRRCVVDEAHDVLGGSAARRERLRACRSVRADVWIGLTATPNVSDASALQEWATLLLEEEDGALHPCLARRMEASLIQQFAAPSQPPARRRVHRIALPPLERAVYETCASEVAENDATRLVQLCSSAGAYFHDRTHSVEGVFDTLVAVRQECMAEMLMAPAVDERRVAEVEAELCHLAEAAAAHPPEALRSRGSKIDAAAALVRSISPSKAVVVAAWKPLLLSAKEALLAAGVVSELLEGPTLRRAAVLRRFREGETAALLLLTHGGFEGHDLGAASHVVFLHAFAESTDEALRIEHQVLGRVQRDEGAAAVLHHLLAADTAEERLWRAQHAGVE